MNAHVIRIQGSAWRPRKGGSVKLVIEVRPGTQAEWVEALEMFKQRPELSITVVAPKVAVAGTTVVEASHIYRPPGLITNTVPTDTLILHRSSPPNESEAMKETVAAIKGEFDPNFKKHNFSGVSMQGYDAIGPKADVDCPVPGCDLLFEHEGGCSHLPDCPKPNCNMIAGHPGKCVKKKVKA